ncbi:MAG: hypothetical protein K8S99_16175 [Planctomycetes bacterium]|nr:hypothetical protein [Planctomycetota bacterium]
MEQQPKSAYWNYVARHWYLWTPPLRPCAADVRVTEEAVRTHAGGATSRAVLWGVTPEIANMAWPAGMELTAVDRVQEMIDHVWPGDIAGRRAAVCGDWLEYPADHGGYRAVVGDGVFSLMDYPDGHRLLAAKAHALLDAGGVLVVRLFAQGAKRETPAAVLDDLRAGRIGSFHIFKFRLAMALQRSAQAGVRMGDIFEAWVRAEIDPDALAASTGWSREVIATIDHYRDKDSRLIFPTPGEFHAVVGETFDRLDCRFPTYEMGDRCPTVYYRKREG